MSIGRSYSLFLFNKDGQLLMQDDANFPAGILSPEQSNPLTLVNQLLGLELECDLRYIFSSKSDEDFVSQESVIYVGRLKSSIKKEVLESYGLTWTGLPSLTRDVYRESEKYQAFFSKCFKKIVRNRKLLA